MVLAAACARENATPSAPTLKNLDRRFTEPATEKPFSAIVSPSTVSPCSLDGVNDRPAAEKNIVGEKSKVILSGWAADMLNQVAADEMWIEISGPSTVYLKASGSTEKRPDVASYFNNPAMLETGWRIYANLSSLASGDYLLRVIMRTGTKTLICDTKRRLILE